MKGSSDRRSNIGACNTANSPPNINPPDEADAPNDHAAICAKCPDDGQLQASRQYASVDFAPFVSCGDVQAAVFPGVNSFGFSNTGANSADVITSAISASGDGVARIDQGRATAVALAAVNIGRTSQVTLEARSLSNAIAGAFTVEFCATNPATGQCLGERAETLSFDFARNEVRTFTAFIRSTGDPIAFNPRDNRIGFFFGRESPATSLAITVQ
ncbi:hypothetical protein HXX25_10010 [Hyphobacterium sp. CCMP332]|uniref:hypothetical protein n=1 Tax=Hyphobacterium sp. CCMP332 TaxID=2749086 RepID=UPI00164F8960|nr:hypothetical protein [Hyphobacterium sp. CCMP332]QNL19627.1 hypothetical protein HXX25_10010 [Hyphobacterium sp. CCMP332]